LLLSQTGARAIADIALNSRCRTPSHFAEAIATDIDLRVRKNSRIVQALLSSVGPRDHSIFGPAAGDYNKYCSPTTSAGRAVNGTGIGRVVITGLSLGSTIAMLVALDAIQQRAGLTPVGTPATTDWPIWQTRGDRARLRAPLRGGGEDPARAAGDGPGKLRGLRRRIRDRRLADRPGAIVAPTFIVSGDRDIPTPFEECGDYLIAHIASGRHVARDDTNLPPLRAPDAPAAARINLYSRGPHARRLPL
jgi:pimeloyl-ACP methyl ester carboxylesterase